MTHILSFLSVPHPHAVPCSALPSLSMLPGGSEQQRSVISAEIQAAARGAARKSGNSRSNGCLQLGGGSSLCAPVPKNKQTSPEKPLTVGSVNTREERWGGDVQGGRPSCWGFLVITVRGWELKTLCSLRWFELYSVIRERGHL